MVALLRRLPRSYRPGRLLNSLAHELKGAERRHYADPARAEFTWPDGLVFDVVERIEKSFLAYTVVADFECRISGSEPGEAQIHLAHTGGLTRTGIAARVKRGQVEAVAGRLTGDGAFVQAILPLDFKHFHLTQDAAGWLAVTSQVGAAWVSMTLPPMQRYVPMGRDQVIALGAVFRRLQDLLTAAPPAAGRHT